MRVLQNVKLQLESYERKENVFTFNEENSQKRKGHKYIIYMKYYHNLRDPRETICHREPMHASTIWYAKKPVI